MAIPDFQSIMRQLIVARQQAQGAAKSPPAKVAENLSGITHLAECKP